MTRRTAHAHRLSREEAGCIDFDAALETFFEIGEAEELLRASGLVLGSAIPLDKERAETIVALTGCPHMLEDYDDAGRAVRRWFALTVEPGARH